MQRNLNLRLNLYWGAEWQLRQSYRRPAMVATLHSEYIDYQVREAIDDGRRLHKTRRHINHPERPKPRGDAIE